MLAAIVLAGALTLPYEPLVGTIDTIGGTSYDWWFGGPAYRLIANAPGHGLHVTWMHSTALAGSSYPDRNLRYRFFEFAGDTWLWPDTTWVNAGMNAFAERSGFGNIAVDQRTGSAVIGRQWARSGTVTLGCARDIAAGAGLFEYATDANTDNYAWSVTAVDTSGIVHQLAMTQDYLLGYFRISTWPDYGPAVTGFVPGPSFPSHNLATAGFGQRLVCCWVAENWPAINQAFFCESTDRGTTWGRIVELVPPQAFGGDTLTSFHITSLHPFYDRDARLHFTVNLMPVVNDTGYAMPSAIWHWSEGVWTEITRAGCDPAHLLGTIGYNATYACRPNLGADDFGNLHVVWEQFDSMNVEPVTGRLRADVFYSRSGDNGLTWSLPTKLTDAGTNSCRYPTITELISASRDTLDILYLLDITAGFAVQGEHPNEYNPVIVHHVPLSFGAEERQAKGPLRTELLALPSVIRDAAQISYTLVSTDDVRLVLHNVSGQVVRTLVLGPRPAGTHSKMLLADKLPTGVFFLTLESRDTRLSRKVVISR